ncbi:hypothetical protein PIB30_091148 [Stylosanthes scabra]|uniref:Uncharacterized protein n=1 Tax=Stylosanthes scabra TaxID=79078 RepID=A0ABU6RUT2_9FABA|nr:hypothetical protein [Stylosanthes scabra]
MSRVEGGARGSNGPDWIWKEGVTRLMLPESGGTYGGEVDIKLLGTDRGSEYVMEDEKRSRKEDLKGAKTQLGREKKRFTHYQE